ncbi:hypothetical protein GQS40_13310|uniref:pyridoxal 5'-phosphate synthase (glutamine hydrolyzing) n=1 Tax=Leuconostoc lactis TaxID=1246 RepID=A0A6L7ADQ3_LEULA|nr:hypothetical protein [Leuconostoc lactis]
MKLEAVGVDYIDESEVLTPADDTYHIDKTAFEVPFVCGCRDLGEALRRIGEGASMLRTKGEPGTGNINNVEQAKIAEAAGAVAVMALERVPSDIRAAGGVARMSDPAMVEQIMAVVTIPVMAKARIGHFVEARGQDRCSF